MFARRVAGDSASLAITEVRLSRGVSDVNRLVSSRMVTGVLQSWQGAVVRAGGLLARSGSVGDQQATACDHWYCR